MSAAAEREPSAWPHRLLVVALALLALAIATWLALVQWHVVAWVWDPLPGNPTAVVLGSRLSRGVRRLLHVPDAALGGVAYLAEATLALVGSARRARERPWLVLAYGAITAAAAVGGLMLTTYQAFVLRALCVLCLTTAALSLAILLLALPEAQAAWSSARGAAARTLHPGAP